MSSTMKRFNSNTVRALGNLQGLTELQKRDLRRLNGTKSRWAVDKETTTEVKKVREYLAPVATHFVPAKPRGRSGCRLSHEKRLSILNAAAAKATARKAFFAEMGLKV